MATSFPLHSTLQTDRNSLAGGFFSKRKAKEGSISFSSGLHKSPEEVARSAITCLFGRIEWILKTPRPCSSSRTDTVDLSNCRSVSGCILTSLPSKFRFDVESGLQGVSKLELIEEYCDVCQTLSSESFKATLAASDTGTRNPGNMADILQAGSGLER